MKTNIEKFFKLLLVILTFISFSSVNVFANEKEIVIKEKSYIKVSEDETDTRREAKFLTTNGYAYCITPEKIGAKEGTVYSYAGLEDNATLVYLLSQGNDENDFDYLAKQLAIWKAINNFIPEYYLNHPDTDVLRKTDELINDAIANAGNYNRNTSVEIKYDGAEFEIAEINGAKYLKSGIVTVSITNGLSAEYTLKHAPKGTKLIDLNGNELNSVSNENKFYIAIPYPITTIREENKFDLTVSVKGVVKVAERYIVSGGLQDLVVLDQRESSDKATMSFTVGIDKSKENRCELVDGKYYDADGKETDKETYLTTCEVHKCEKVDDLYFDKDGKITDIDEYDKQCVKHTCEIIGDTYFNALGEISSYEEYSSQCVEKISCEYMNGKYIGVNGNEVSHDEFVKQCRAQIVAVPDTATTGIISTIIGLSILALIGKFVIKNHKELN